MDLEYRGAWLTWVAAATSCLRALDVDCDLWDVAGMTGYAFVMSVSPDLCPSGPTMFDWGMLDSGIHALGRSTLTFGSGDCHTGKFINQRTTAHCREAFELTRREVDAGRPVVLWGAYVPEFVVAYGVREDSYIVRSWKPDIGEEDTPIPFDQIDAPGGPYVMAFPTPTDPKLNQRFADNWAIRNAIRLLTAPSLFQTHSTGLAAYGTWITALESGSCHPFGLAYNSQCWAEAKAFARGFIPRVAERNPAAAGPLGTAAEQFSKTELALIELAKLFPFPPASEEVSPEQRDHAIAALRAGHAAETDAVAALREALAVDWELKQDAAAG
jgi:hypothetical protein